MKTLLEYAPRHLVRDDREERPILSNMLPSFFDDANVPIQATKAEWSYIDNPQRLVRLFEFESYDNLKYFIDALLEYQQRVQHHAKLTVEAYSIYVESFTHTLETVTELDIALSKFCDEVYEDLNYLARAREEKEYVINQ